MVGKSVGCGSPTCRGLVSGTTGLALITYIDHVEAVLASLLNQEVVRVILESEGNLPLIRILRAALNHLESAVNICRLPFRVQVLKLRIAPFGDI